MRTPSSAAASLAGPRAVQLQRLPDHLAAALKKRWKCYRKELKCCQRKFSEKAVHQFRVESRRLLSLIELPAAFLAPAGVEKIRDCLKQHLDTFDNLRDTHVQLQLTNKLRKDYPEAKVFESYLRKREKRVDRRTRKDVKRIKTKPLAKLIIACRQDLETRLGILSLPDPPSPRAGRSRPVRTRRSSAAGERGTPGALLLRSVDSAFHHTVELKNSINPGRTKTIHCTRVAFKKFRYMVETLSGFLPVATAKRLAAMHRYQTLMGDIQDMEVLIRAFEKFSAKQDLKRERVAVSLSSRRSRRPEKTFREVLLHRRRQLITRYLARADELHSFWPPAP